MDFPRPALPWGWRIGGAACPPRCPGISLARTRAPCERDQPRLEAGSGASGGLHSFIPDQHVRHQHRARHHWADVVRRSQPAGALTLSQVERKTMTVLLYLFVAVLLATGLSLLWLGATLLMLGDRKRTRLNSSH